MFITTYGLSLLLQIGLSRLIIQTYLKEDLVNTGSIGILYNEFRAQIEGTESRSNVSRVNVL